MTTQLNQAIATLEAEHQAFIAKGLSTLGRITETVTEARQIADTAQAEEATAATLLASTQGHRDAAQAARDAAYTAMEETGAEYRRAHAAKRQVAEAVRQANQAKHQVDALASGNVDALTHWLLNSPVANGTLHLDFANQSFQVWEDGRLQDKAFGEALTFTRASEATYWGADGKLHVAGVDEPRFDHDPVTGEPLGILVERTSTNIFTNSIRPHAVGAGNFREWVENIDGTMTAMYGARTSEQGGGTTYLRTLQLPSTSARLVVSVWAKAPPDESLNSQLYLCWRNNRLGKIYPSIRVNLKTGVQTSGSSSDLLSVEPSANGFWKVVFAFSDWGEDALDGDSLWFYIGANSANWSNGHGIVVGAWQCEVISEGGESSLIVTEEAPVTRASDGALYVRDAGRVLNADKFTAVVSGKFNALSEGHLIRWNNNSILRVGAEGSSVGTFNNVGFTSSGSRFLRVGGSPIDQYLPGGGHTHPSIGEEEALDVFYQAFAIDSLGLRVTSAMNGDANTRELAYPLPWKPSNIVIGERRISAHVRQVSVYPYAMTEQELIDLTTINEE